MPDAKTILDQMVVDLANFHGQTLVPMADQSARTHKMGRNTPFYRAVYHLGQLINKYKRESSKIKPVEANEELIGAVVRTADCMDEIGCIEESNVLDTFAGVINSELIKKSAFDGLVKIASDLDFSGQPGIADQLDTLLLKSRENVDMVNDLIDVADKCDDVGEHSLADGLEQVAAHLRFAEKPVVMPHEGTLSTRYCPDHIGIQAIRIDEGVFQCPIDGKKYDYINGYNNYKQQVVPGGSVAAQTPTNTDYGGVPMRFYDNRQSVLNSMH